MNHDTLRELVHFMEGKNDMSREALVDLKETFGKDTPTMQLAYCYVPVALDMKDIQASIHSSTPAVRKGGDSSWYRDRFALINRASDSVRERCHSLNFSGNTVPCSVIWSTTINTSNAIAILAVANNDRLAGRGIDVLGSLQGEIAKALNTSNGVNDSDRANVINMLSKLSNWRNKRAGEILVFARTYHVMGVVVPDTAKGPDKVLLFNEKEAVTQIPKAITGRQA